MAIVRNKLAGILAIIGGALIFLSGGVGMVDFLKSLHGVVNELTGESYPILETIFWILIVIAMLGGISVIIGGYLIWKGYPRIGRVLIILGTSVGLIGLIISLLTAMYGGTTDNFLAWLTTSVAGVGVVLAIAAQQIAK